MPATSRDGVVIEAIERHPGDPTILSTGPLGQQRRLAVPGRRRDANKQAVTRTSGLDQSGAAHAIRVRLRDRELGVEQQLIEQATIVGGDPSASCVTVEA